mgnify:FL=1
MMIDKTFKVSAVIMASLLLASCAGDNTDLHEYIEHTRSKHLGSVEPLPQFKPYRNFTYSASELRDPFEPAFQIEEDEEKVAGLRPDSSRPREPLEEFPMDTLRMVGILEQKGDVWGLVKDPQNVVHRVQVGNYAGQNEGQIVSVSEDKIELIEIISDGLGGYIERNATLVIGEN